MSAQDTLHGRADTAEIRRAVSLVCPPDSVVELRVPKAGRLKTISGYYNDHDKLVEDAAKLSGQAGGVYITLNQINPALLARAANRTIPYAENTTKDEHVERRRFFFGDVDATRPSGISATDEQHEAALEKAREVSKWLQSEFGFSQPIFGDSGNGGHLLFRVDLPNTPEVNDLFKRALQALSQRFTDARVNIDTTTYNAARLFKLPGTLAAKGDSIPGQPHRFARLIDVPASLEITPLESFERLAATLAVESPKIVTPSSNGFDVQAFLSRNGLEVVDSGAWNGATKWSLKACPFNSDHARTFYILQYPNGAIVAGCLHKSCKPCSGQTWKELREMYEPRATNSQTDTEPQNNSAQEKPSESFITSFPDFMGKDFQDGEEIAFHACRGEIVLIQSVTNQGKTTLTRNAALTLAAGGGFLSVVKRSVPRKVLLLNFEGAAGRFQSDLRVMTRDLTDAELTLIRENLFPTHAPVVDDEPLSLSRHLRLIEVEAQAKGVDVVIVDTASAAFSIRNENDNAEIANYVMKRLVKLARKLNCLVILVHHIGKAKSEEGQSREQAHRGRGASAWADFSTSIFNLEVDSKDKNMSTLTCGKRKDGEAYELMLRLDREARWLSATNDSPPRIVTNDDLVLEAMQKIGGREMQTIEIERALAGKVEPRTVRNCLKRLYDTGKIGNPKRGRWVVLAVTESQETTYRDFPNFLTEGGSGQTVDNSGDKLEIVSDYSQACYFADLPDEVAEFVAQRMEAEHLTFREALACLSIQNGYEKRSIEGVELLIAKPNGHHRETQGDERSHTERLDDGRLVLASVPQGGREIDENSIPF